MGPEPVAVDSREIQRLFQMRLEVPFFILCHRAIGDAHGGAELQEDGRAQIVLGRFGWLVR